MAAGVNVEFHTATMDRKSGGGFVALSEATLPAIGLIGRSTRGTCSSFAISTTRWRDLYPTRPSTMKIRQRKISPYSGKRMQTSV